MFVLLVCSTCMHIYSLSSQSSISAKRSNEDVSSGKSAENQLDTDSSHMTSHPKKCQKTKKCIANVSSEAGKLNVIIWTYIYKERTNDYVYGTIHSIMYVCSILDNLHTTSICALLCTCSYTVYCGSYILYHRSGYFCHQNVFIVF